MQDQPHSDSAIIGFAALTALITAAATLFARTGLGFPLRSSAPASQSQRCRTFVPARGTGQVECNVAISELDHD
jgi:ABC-type uncharacterized transport system permease subunit